MGTDAKAAIIYGFSFAGECDSGFKDDSGFDAYNEDSDQWLCEAQGLSNPEEGHWRAVSKLPIGIELEGDLSGGTTTDYLCIREAVIRGDWDGSTEIPMDHIRQMPEWDAMLKAFCEKAGIEFQTPKWYLIASMG